VVTDHSEAARFVERYDLGLCSAAEAGALASALERVIASPDLRRAWRANTREAIRAGHSWDDRAKTLLQDLLGEKTSS
jgi:glycosyltransferase involved in cell wall biosynthesis